MTSFELIDNPPSDSTPEPGYCLCPVDGPRRNVVVDIDEGRVLAIACAHCEMPIRLNAEDTYEGIYANGLTLVMTTSVEGEGDGVEAFHELSEHLEDQ